MGMDIYSDKTALMIIVRNLLHTAIKFSFKKGRVQISAIKKNNQINISVQDWGIGMTKEQMSYLFKINKRIKTKGTNGEMGTGIGLAFCNDLVNLLDGSIEVESTPGQGTSFYVKLPANKG